MKIELTEDEVQILRNSLLEAKGEFEAMIQCYESTQTREILLYRESITVVNNIIGKLNEN